MKNRITEEPQQRMAGEGRCDDEGSAVRGFGLGVDAVPGELCFGCEGKSGDKGQTARTEELMLSSTLPGQASKSVLIGKVNSDWAEVVCDNGGGLRQLRIRWRTCGRGAHGDGDSIFFLMEFRWVHDRVVVEATRRSELLDPGLVLDSRKQATCERRASRGDDGEL
ncbi:hypothetical protein PanWU01x14_054310 [Parasponia andersonii]|uniref:Uncharacterized protein n=1 Tax=Parasponia andersonii TaxID=3476 RepID=A0A2P5DKQ4_PARAD|nr:hypothetical protein PanWU01x14_054310 [Parasponia andersonii]